jgi:aminocarboxymuconate-semialdehyde decarboxylase
MPNRREFLRHAAGAAAGVFCAACGLRRAAAQGGPGAAGKHREVTVGGRRIKTIDVHCHCTVPDVLDLVKGTAMEKALRQQLTGALGFPVGPERIAHMDGDGIDVQAMSVNAYWYGADRDLARRIVDMQNERLAKICAAFPERVTAFATVALQFPEIAAEQLERGVKELGLCGAAIGGSVEGEELSSRRLDPFWAKAQALQALIFIHPQTAPESTGVAKRVEGSGALGNVIGNPLETTIALSHLIFEGTLDRFPELKICAAHGGGYLPSYAARMDHGCSVFPNQCKEPALQKQPSEYLKQLYFDSIVFTPEGLRHLVAASGASQVVIGTDYAVPWVNDPVDLILDTPTLSDADRIAILGGTAAKLLRLPA